MFFKRKKEEQKAIKLNVLSNRKSSMIKKAAISVLLLSGFSFNMAFANEAESNSDLKEIHHIYSSGEYVGALSDTSGIQEMIDKKIEASSPQYENLSLKAGSDLSVVSEQVFTSSTKDKETLQKLDKLIEVEATAFALSVNDEIAVYVKDLATYEETLRKFKLNFITEEQLTALEARSSSSESLPDLQENETRISELILKEKVSGVTSGITPDEVVAADEAVKILLNGAVEQETYTVATGDVLGSIASKFDLTAAEIVKLNPGITDSTVLQIGQTLNVTVSKPLINVEALYEKKVVEVIKQSKTVKESDDMYKGDTKVQQEGSDGEKVATYLLRKENGTLVGQSLKEETVLVEPIEHIVLKGTKVIPSRGAGTFAWPAEGGYISSKMGYRWGRQHAGIDIARPSGYTIKAADNGIVIASGMHDTYGNRVVIDHQNGYKTTYAHMSSLSVSVGDVVPQGSKLGVMGSTGRSTGTHLHFEVEKNGATIDPLTVLN
ncbi:murein DD-endopeptidase MepM/ murein hydrolase activator NlpD [Psychrobacillus insolitus]|uniref:Murein DD-endopeptidase MepM/ murein hydrolase activator NlpD n=1 Tax=Psychrobacillus insolitus TaxID=1461 RepID=A0A2W7N457_9BACI|nr:M23 family metallopeptidase [Psychrobacillus insolitus]PZX03721.1 murein DD-endopeptidase MepM/ murein hydrolase activator NlpD [Psychrobacillus insolitus]